MAIAETFWRARAHHRISDLAAIERCKRPRRGHRTPNGDRDRSPDRDGFAWRGALGNTQHPYWRTGVSTTHAQRCRDDCVFVGNGRPPKRLRDDTPELSGAMRGAHFALPIRAGNALPE